LAVTDERRLLAQQIAYYRARAGEYDEWFFRRGRYDRGAAHRASWFEEIAHVEHAVREAALTGDILELASGTGLWTRHLDAPANHILAVDSSTEALALNRQRVGSDRVSYVAADIFALPISGTFDVVFFSFWLSHVPDDRFDAFWAVVASRLRPGGRVFLIDGLREQSSTATDHGPIDDSGIARRRLNDGRTFEVVKVFRTPEVLQRRLQRLGWAGWVRPSGRFFLYGLLHRAGLGQASRSTGPERKP
jgi:demethylmenaquinone methyltransferase/2-methoxy-6-polyprenyl-1,4-benzoquinol methylase